MILTALHAKTSLSFFIKIDLWARKSLKDCQNKHYDRQNERSSGGASFDTGTKF